MKKAITIVILFSSIAMKAQDIKKELSALASYNFLGGNNTLNNLTPEVFYGFKDFVKGAENESFGFQLMAGPYVSSQISVKDSSSFIPALMLQGNTGLVVNNYLFFGKDSKFMLSLFNFSLKLLSNFTDSAKTILQHNLRFAIGYKYKELIALTCQYTIGWHNLTSQSELTYKQILPDVPRELKYLNISLQIKVSKDDTNPLFLISSWRTLLNNKHFSLYPNHRILSIGFRKSIEMSNGTPAVMLH